MGPARSALTEIRSQVTRYQRLIIAIYVPVALILLVLAGIQWMTNIDAGRFTRDPLAVAEKPMYFGSVSTLGNLVWFAAMVSCLFTSALMFVSGGHRMMNFMLAAGLVTGILVVDDLFMLHEAALPHLGVPELLVYGGYGLLIPGFIYSFRSTILQSRYVVFLLFSLAAFFFSVGWDVVEPAISDTQWYLIEDGAKFVGIVSWSTFFIMTAFHHLSQMIPADGKSGVSGARP